MTGASRDRRLLRHLYVGDMLATVESVLYTSGPHYVCKYRGGDAGHGRDGLLRPCRR